MKLYWNTPMYWKCRIRTLLESATSYANFSSDFCIKSFFSAHSCTQEPEAKALLISLILKQSWYGRTGIMIRVSQKQSRNGVESTYAGTRHRDTLVLSSVWVHSKTVEYCKQRLKNRGAAAMNVLTRGRLDTRDTSTRASDACAQSAH